MVKIENMLSPKNFFHACLDKVFSSTYIKVDNKEYMIQNLVHNVEI